MEMLLLVTRKKHPIPCKVLIQKCMIEYERLYPIIALLGVSIDLFTIAKYSFVLMWLEFPNFKF